MSYGKGTPSVDSLLLLGVKKGVGVILSVMSSSRSNEILSCLYLEASIYPVDRTEALGSRQDCLFPENVNSAQ